MKLTQDQAAALVKLIREPRRLRYELVLQAPRGAVRVRFEIEGGAVESYEIGPRGAVRAR